MFKPVGYFSCLSLRVTSFLAYFVTFDFEININWTQIQSINPGFFSLARDLGQVLIGITLAPFEGPGLLMAFQVQYPRLTLGWGLGPGGNRHLEILVLVLALAPWHPSFFSLFLDLRSDCGLCFISLTLPSLLSSSTDFLVPY